MSISNAKKFLIKAANDKPLRTSLGKTSTRKQIIGILNDINCQFTDEELDEAFRNLLVQCQTEDEAEHLKEIKQWWNLLLCCTPAQE